MTERYIYNSPETHLIPHDLFLFSQEAVSLIDHLPEVFYSETLTRVISFSTNLKLHPVVVAAARLHPLDVLHHGPDGDVALVICLHPLVHSPVLQLQLLPCHEGHQPVFQSKHFVLSESVTTLCHNNVYKTNQEFEASE